MLVMTIQSMLRIWLNHLHWNDTALNNWPTLSMFVCLVPPAEDYSNKYAEKQQCPTKWQKMNFVFKATDNKKNNDLFERLYIWLDSYIENGTPGYFSTTSR